jgi:hypothetical protein
MQGEGHELRWTYLRHVKLMNRKHIYDNHVIERYLADQLDDTEREAFEAYYLQHPEVVSDMESVARLKVGLADLRDRNELTPLLQSQRPPSRLLAIAAVVALLAIGVLAYFVMPRTQQPVLVAATSSPIAATYDILRMRGAADDAQIELPASPQAIGLRVLPETEAATYTMTLLRIADDGNPQQLASLSPLTADTDGFVIAYLNSGELSQGRYQLVLRGDVNADAASAESRFTLTLH